MEFTVVDLVLLIALSSSLLPLVTYYLRDGIVPPSTQGLIAFGGLLWVGFSLVGQTVSQEGLDVWLYDAWGHQWHGEWLASQIDQGRWEVWTGHFKTGNHAYHCYIALILYIGGSINAVTMINGWLCFWGGLIMTRCLGGLCPGSERFRRWVFAVIFFPSALFWGTLNLKEGLMYWAICCLLSSTFQSGGRNSILGGPLLPLGVLVAGLMRPHVALGWVAAVMAANVLQSGRRVASIALLAVLPVLFFAVQAKTGAGLSTESTLDMMEMQAENLKNIPGQGSAIEHSSGKPIFFVSGFINAFFRPFPWRVGSLRVFLSCLETWSMTVAIAVVWWKYGKTFGRLSWKMPSVKASTMGTIWMCILLSYFPNEGLVARQRVQMIPGLLTLALAPMMLREAFRERMRLAGLVLHAVASVPAAAVPEYRGVAQGTRRL